MVGVSKPEMMGLTMPNESAVFNLFIYSSKDTADAIRITCSVGDAHRHVLTEYHNISLHSNATTTQDVDDIKRSCHDRMSV